MKKNRYNTKEKCLEEALKYKNPFELKKNNRTVHTYMYRNGWREEFYPDIPTNNNFGKKQAKNNYWTKDRCFEEALKHKSKTEFKNNAPGAYAKCFKNNWLKEVCVHMALEYKPQKYWTKERCFEEALKYKLRNDFKKNAPGAVKSAKKNGWYDEICSHMNLVTQKPCGYWNDKETCRNEALKYKDVTHFRAKENGCFNSIIRNGWYDELCSHLTTYQTNGLKINYAFEFSDNHVYVGLTFDIEIREKEHYGHNKRSQVYKHMKKTGLIPKLIFDEPKSVKKALQKEVEMYNKYKDEGWIMLTKKCGGLGSTVIKWTKKACYEETLKYTRSKDFRKNSKGAYDAACKRGWLKEITQNLIKRKENGYWTKDKCREEALKHETIKSLMQENKTVYEEITKNKWSKELFFHMKLLKKPSGYWTKERCLLECVKYESVGKWSKSSTGSYWSAKRNGWLDECKLCISMEMC